MTVNGNLTFQSGSFYVVQVNPATASNTIVSGTASLRGHRGGRLYAGHLCDAQLPDFDGHRRDDTFDGLVTRSLPSDFRSERELTSALPHS